MDRSEYSAAVCRSSKGGTDTPVSEYAEHCRTESYQRGVISRRTTDYTSQKSYNHQRSHCYQGTNISPVFTKTLAMNDTQKYCLMPPFIDFTLKQSYFGTRFSQIQPYYFQLFQYCFKCNIPHAVYCHLSAFKSVYKNAYILTIVHF